MKNEIRRFLYGLSIPMSMYLAMAFAEASWDISTWDARARAFCSFLCVFLVFGYLLMTSDKIDFNGDF